MIPRRQPTGVSRPLRRCETGASDTLERQDDSASNAGSSGICGRTTLGKIDQTDCGMSEHVFMVDVLKYAVVERERRFVVAGIPEGVTQTFRIEDYYIELTRLRLRRVMAADASLTCRPHERGHHCARQGSPLPTPTRGRAAA